MNFCEGDEFNYWEHLFVVSLALLDDLICVGKLSLRMNMRDEGWMFIIHAVLVMF